VPFCRASEAGRAGISVSRAAAGLGCWAGVLRTSASDQDGWMQWWRCRELPWATPSGPTQPACCKKLEGIRVGKTQMGTGCVCFCFCSGLCWSRFGRVSLAFVYLRLHPFVFQPQRTTPLSRSRKESWPAFEVRVKQTIFAIHGHRMTDCKSAGCAAKKRASSFRHTKK